MSRARWHIASRREMALHVRLVTLVAGIGCQSALELDQYAFYDETAPEPPAKEDGAGMGGTSGASGLGNGGGGGSLQAADVAATGVDTLGSVPGQGGGSGAAAGGAQNGSAGSGEMTPPAVGGTGPGAAGAMGTGPLPIPGTCEEGGDWQVDYTDRAGTIENQMSMILEVRNAGVSMPLSDLVFRYWFNADGHIDFTADLDFVSVDNASLTDNVTARFGTALGSHYGDIGFVGTDRELVSSATIQVRLHTTSYDLLDQSNDFSYVADADRISNRNIAIYLDGALVSGCEPEPP